MANHFQKEWIKLDMVLREPKVLTLTVLAQEAT